MTLVKLALALALTTAYICEKVNAGNVGNSLNNIEKEKCFTGNVGEILDWCATLKGEERCCVDNNEVSPTACQQAGESNTICEGSCWGVGACSEIRDATIHSYCTRQDSTPGLPGSGLIPHHDINCRDDINRHITGDTHTQILEVRTRIKA